MLKKYKNVGGFTLIEMIVSLAIVSIILTTVIFNYSSFTDNLALSSAAQELAITIRQAQTYGLSVKQVVATGKFESAYGIYVDTGDNANYYLFADSVHGDSLYDSGELIQKISFRDGIKISDVNNGTVGLPLNKTGEHITFLRPSPNAIIYFTNSSGGYAGITPPTPGYTVGNIVLISPKNKTITLTIQSTGEVSIGGIK